MNAQNNNEIALAAAWFDTANRCRASGMIMSRQQAESLITMAPKHLEVAADSPLFNHGSVMAEWNWLNFDSIGLTVVRSDEDEEAMQDRLLDFSEQGNEPSTAEELYTYLMGYLAFSPEHKYQQHITPKASMEFAHA